MHLLLLLDQSRSEMLTKTFQVFCIKSRWERNLEPIFVMGSNKATTLSYTSEFGDIFYNAQEFMSIEKAQDILTADDISRITYIHQGFIWERTPQDKWKLIYNPENYILSPQFMEEHGLNRAFSF